MYTDHVDNVPMPIRARWSMWGVTAIAVTYQKGNISTVLVVLVSSMYYVRYKTYRAERKIGQ